jgi:hypothetical protein
MTQANVALLNKINYLSEYIISKEFDSLDVNQRANLVVELRDSVAIHSENAYKDSIMMMISMRD